jgi:hypothetical protein
LAHQIASPEASGLQRLGKVSGRLAPCALLCIAHNKNRPSRAPFHCAPSWVQPALMPPVFSTIRPTTINGKDHNMTFEQSLDLAELQADMAFETYLSAFEEGDHPEVIDSLATEALIAQDRCADLRSQDLAH